MATIVKTPAGTWKAVIRKTGWPTQAKTFRVKRDAVDWARRIEDEIVRGVFIQRSTSERTSLSHALNRYLNEVSITKKPSTQRNEKIKAVNLNEKIGKYALAMITPEVVATYRDGRLEEGRSNNTVRLELALLSHLFTIAIKEWGMGLTYNPVANIRKPTPGKGRERRLVGDEEERLLNACDEHENPMLGWMVRLALYTAMRLGEIRNLTRSQVNLKRNVITLFDTKNNETRSIPLSQKAKKVLQEVLTKTARPIDSDLIFYGHRGRDGKLRPYVINKLWIQALDRAGITNLRFHDLRHEATSRFVEAGLSDQQVASITGHKSMQMLKRYTHLRSEDLVNRISQL